MRVVPVAFVILAACGGSVTETEEPTPVAEAEPEPAPIEYESPVVSGTIERAQLVPVIDAGLGRFLQGVDTEPDLREGNFVGFTIRRLYPQDERFATLDLQPGDTVTRINGEPIERPEQALRVWEGLRVSSQLLVEYLRDGEEDPRTLRFAIVD